MLQMLWWNNVPCYIAAVLRLRLLISSSSSDSLYTGTSLLLGGGGVSSLGCEDLFLIGGVLSTSLSVGGLV